MNCWKNKYVRIYWDLNSELNIFEWFRFWVFIVYYQIYPEVKVKDILGDKISI